ncbi:septation ring formation regulator EzrA [Bacillus smithii]|uniref:septation ring formation regulator EzrA n=1 Tax=Bacillus smithii TaxID=1479 RepID=UPI002E2127D4|nr:septation ring formation regulator EzrA [Bacillus smithii]MED1455862.1 septation ring formation regulator EzrA [Bacillus smithii]
MEFVIGTFILIIIMVIIGFIMKRKKYQAIDQLDKRKIEIMNRPVADELKKVKKLNMTGQTEELFERWRQTWDEIITTELPAIDEKLIDAESCIDKYRFRKAQEIMRQIEESLDSAEEKIDNLLQELNELVGSEEKNRRDMEEIKEKYRSARKRLLAHRHTYGKTAPILEIKLDSLSSQFDQFEELTAEGNYLEARELVLNLKEEMADLLHKMERIPVLIPECTSLLPSQLDELEEGYKEMEKQGYILNHLQLDKEIARIRKELDLYKDLIAKTEVQEVEDSLNETRENIDLLYELLEKEVKAKHDIIQNNNQTFELLQKLKKNNRKLKEETQLVQESYHLVDEQIDVPKKLDKELSLLEKRYEIVSSKIFAKQSAYSLLNDDLMEIRKSIESLQEEQERFAEFLGNLRKDELAARDKLEELRRMIHESHRKVAKSNVPGLPDSYKSLMEDASERINEVIQCLQMKPLNMNQVQDKLELAVEAVEVLNQKTDELIEQVFLAEKVIQYGNRYRSQYPNVREKLIEAEKAFRNYEFSEALEQAAAAVEKVDPQFLKKLSDLLNMDGKD